MNIYLILILFNLSLPLVHLKHVPLVDDNEEYLILPQKPKDYECNIENLLDIKDYFERTTVIRSNNTDIQYCGTTESRHEPPPEPGLEVIHIYPTVERVVYGYMSFANVDTYETKTTNSPIIAYAVLTINDTEEIPLCMTAIIRKQHLQPPDSRPNYGQDVGPQMELMGQLESDDRGHLLAHSLGGSSTPLNIVPMARNLTRHFASVDDNQELGTLRSYWKSNEEWIYNFLNDSKYPDGAVDWRIAVQYPGDTVANPSNNYDFRPVRFSLAFTAYANYKYTRSVVFNSSERTFLNNNDYACDLEETNRDNTFLSDLNWKSCRRDHKSFKGEMGNELDSGEWDKRYPVSFPFKIGGIQYFYRLSILDGPNWFIQELLPDGKMGQETDHGFLADYYTVVFPYLINGRQFFYGHSTKTKPYWIIRELLPGGKMGDETDRGLWTTRHAVSFPFTIDGKHYFYGQSIIDGHHWFIKELLPNGRMGQEKDHGSWDDNYPVVFPFNSYRLYFYGHNSNSQKWFIRELLRDGLMGEEIDHGIWCAKHQVSFPIKIYSKKYFYRQNIEDKRDWYVQELLYDGRMGEEISRGVLNDSYPVVVPFSVKDKQFLYLHSTVKKTWFIRSLS